MAGEGRRGAGGTRAPVVVAKRRVGSLRHCRRRQGDATPPILAGRGGGGVSGSGSIEGDASIFRGAHGGGSVQPTTSRLTTCGLA